MAFTPYEEWAWTKIKPEVRLDNAALLDNAQLGLCGESGEVADLIKKWRYQDHAIDYGVLVEELGDILFYLVMACRAVGSSLQAVMLANQVKLNKRYPNGFDATRSRRREAQ